MHEGPEIMMPVSPAGAVEQMLLEELRRWRESVDKLTNATNSLDRQLALLSAESRRAAEDRAADRIVLADHSDRINKLESWRDRQDGARGLAGWLVNSPVLGWVFAGAAILWAALNARTH